MSNLIPSYQRSGRNVGVVHFGLGAFHRGHQAVYFDSALRSGLGEWGIYGISPRSSQVTDLLRAANFIYTVNARAGEVQSPSIIGSIFDGALYDLNNPGLIAAITSPELKLLTVTVTEKAYVADDDSTSMANRILDLLFLRFTRGLSAPTLISCDNLTENGAVLKRALEESARARELDRDFQTWVHSLSAPNSMVDRIVPAITPAAIAQFERDFGYYDSSLISTEPFKQWVVQPHPGTPELAKFGVEISDQVLRFEQLKLRIFNGAHSTNAYFSQLSGLEFVYQAMAIPSWSDFIARLQDEVSESFTAPESVEVSEYASTARARMANSAVAHRSAQIAMDGSAKLAQRLFSVANLLHDVGKPRMRVAFAIALWIRFLQSGLPVTDPLADQLITRARNTDDREAVRLVMQTPGLLNSVNPEDCAQIAEFVTELRKFTPLDIAKTL
ncbi:MAG: mannitol dehydrogenase family protein [Actinobacteria bacterium]|nr:mannitol dehydrogenase family protein [Actinomycetota bacterium]